METKHLLKDALGWGIGLWLIGYVLGIVFFFVVPPGAIGFVVLPTGAIVTVWVLAKRVHAIAFSHYAAVALVWTLIAVAFDYLFIVKAFAPADGYYKPDVYAYYILTFIMPLAAGWLKTERHVPLTH